MELEDKVALISGGSRGLGAALARRFAEEGAAVSICARDASDLERAARAIREAVEGSRVFAVPTDVTDREAVESWVARTREKLGPADVLVNNASILGPLVPIERHDPGRWRDVLAVNLTGAFLCARAAVPDLRRRRGSLVNVTSGVGDGGRPEWGAYCVSKNGVEALSEILADELRGDGVRVNLVDPGAMRTSMRAAAYPDEDPETLPEPYEVTDVFLYLASDRSRDVSGRRFRAQEFDVAFR